MENITKKQASLALVAVIFATAMIVGTIAAAAADNMVLAKDGKKHKWHKKHHNNSHNGDSTKQSISQSNKSSQSLSCSANGGSGVGVGNGLLLGIGAGVGGSGGTNLCVNNNPQTNVNTGNNGAVN